MRLTECNFCLVFGDSQRRQDRGVDFLVHAWHQHLLFTFKYFLNFVKLKEASTWVNVSQLNFQIEKEKKK